ncbi:hypothetical protein FJO69_00280 [[Mycoplasma] falconis]|uniref:Uncharacterized protein n=1 Tax=[Mycoplasma] falconis TaxID=92403 RepID=A0A501XBR8_9BACT|nr:hypothetical protein [[Mycoplasma] falconis]TPE58035.1 hypothetical protein FJO69_00280 [[Mycoplasma] falconis]
MSKKNKNEFEEAAEQELSTAEVFKNKNFGKTWPKKRIIKAAVFGTLAFAGVTTVIVLSITLKNKTYDLKIYRDGTKLSLAAASTYNEETKRYASLDDLISWQDNEAIFQGDPKELMLELIKDRTPNNKFLSGFNFKIEAENYNYTLENFMFDAFDKHVLHFDIMAENKNNLFDLYAIRNFRIKTSKPYEITGDNIKGYNEYNQSEKKATGNWELFLTTNSNSHERQLNDINEIVKRVNEASLPKYDYIDKSLLLIMPLLKDQKVFNLFARTQAMPLFVPFNLMYDNQNNQIEIKENQTFEWKENFVKYDSLSFKAQFFTLGTDKISYDDYKYTYGVYIPVEEIYDYNLPINITVRSILD